MVTNFISVLAGAFTLAAGTDPLLAGDSADADFLHLLQMRVDLHSKDSFFFWSEPEPVKTPVVLADAGKSAAAAAAAPATTPQAGTAPAKRTQKDEAVTKALENELKDFISDVKSPAFIAHEAVQHVGQDCWEACDKKGGFCAWCGSGNACCRSGWALNPAECVGVSGYRTKKHECVGPTTGKVELINGNSSSQPAEAGAASSADAANTTANATVNGTAGADASNINSTLGFASAKAAANSTGRYGHKSNSSSRANKTVVHYHAGDAQHDWRPLPIGGMNAPLTGWGFSVVAGLKSLPEMSRFVRRLIESMHCRAVDDAEFRSVVPGVSENRTYEELVDELNTLCDSPAAEGTADASWLERKTGHVEESPVASSQDNALLSFAFPGNSSFGATQKNTSSIAVGMGGIANARWES